MPDIGGVQTCMPSWYCASAAETLKQKVLYIAFTLKHLLINITIHALVDILT